MDKSLKFYEQRNEVLFVLFAAEKCIKKPLTRIEIQKIIYLSNSLSPLRDFILDYFDFRVWNNGPYSKDIQRTLNNLVGQRYLNMVEYTIKQKESKYNENSKYIISNIGRDTVNELIGIQIKKEEYEWILSVLRLISHFGIENVVKIVYEEPTFKNLKNSSNGFGAEIPIYNENKNKIVELAQELKNIGEQDFGYSFNKPGDILLAVFDYLFSEIHQICEELYHG